MGPMPFAPATLDSVLSLVAWRVNSLSEITSVKSTQTVHAKIIQMSVSVTQEFVRKPDTNVTRAVTVKSWPNVQIKNVHVQVSFVSLSVQLRMTARIFLVTYKKNTC